MAGVPRMHVAKSTPRPKAIPFRFSLVIDCKGFQAMCEIRHHTEKWMGVRFVRLEKVEQPISTWSPADNVSNNEVILPTTT